MKTSLFGKLEPEESRFIKPGKVKCSDVLALKGCAGLGLGKRSAKDPAAGSSQHQENHFLRPEAKRPDVLPWD